MYAGPTGPRSTRSPSPCHCSLGHTRLHLGLLSPQVTAFFLVSNPSSAQAGLGFFDGYDSPLAVAVVACNTLIGIAINLVYKYADAVLKCIATDCTAVVLCIISAPPPQITRPSATSHSRRHALRCLSHRIHHPWCCISNAMRRIRCTQLHPHYADWWCTRNVGHLLQPAAVAHPLVRRLCGLLRRLLVLDGRSADGARPRG